MTIEKFETGNERLKECLSQLKRDCVRLNELITLCEEIIEFSTLENIDNYLLKAEEITESFEVIELFIS